MRKAEFYETAQRGLGEKFTLAVEKAVSLVLAFPDVGSLCASGTRRVIIKDFPFWLVYKSSFSGDIIIFAIAHQSRRPGFWINRVYQP